MSGLDSEDFHVTGARGWSLNINKRSAGLGTHQIRCYKSEQAVLLTDVGVSFTSLAAQKCPSEAAGGNRQVEHWNTDLYILILNLTVEHGSTNNSKALFVHFWKKNTCFTSGSFTSEVNSYSQHLAMDLFLLLTFKHYCWIQTGRGPFNQHLAWK